MHDFRRQQAETASDVTTAQDFYGTDRCEACGAFHAGRGDTCDGCGADL